MEKNRVNRELDDWKDRKFMKKDIFKVQTIYDWNYNPTFKINCRRVIVRIQPQDKDNFYYFLGQGYDLEIIVPESYPAVPPFVKFYVKTWHPGVNLVNGIIDEEHSPVRCGTWSRSKNLEWIVKEVYNIFQNDYMIKHFKDSSVAEEAASKTDAAKIAAVMMEDDKSSKTMSLADRLASKKAKGASKDSAAKEAADKEAEEKAKEEEAEKKKAEKAEAEKAEAENKKKFGYKNLNALTVAQDDEFGKIIGLTNDSRCKKLSIARSVMIARKNLDELPTININAFTQFVTNKAIFKLSIKNYNMRCEETIIDHEIATQEVLNRGELLAKRTIRMVKQSDGYLNGHEKKTSALDKIIEIGVYYDIFERKDELLAIEKKHQLKQVILENTYDSEGLTLLDRKKMWQEEREAKEKAMEALLSGGSFS